MPSTMVAVFESRAEAERVAQALEHEGIDRRQIRIADTSTRQEYERGGERRSGGFWSWLFGTDESDGAWNSDTDYYSEGMGRGGAVLTVDVDDNRAMRVQELLEAHGARVEAGGRGEQVGTAREELGAARSDREEVLPVVEEQLRVGKRAVTGAGVRIYTRVTERPVEEDIQLREERVHVDRRSVDRPMPAGTEAFHERSFEVEEMHEEPVVAKEVRIVEEVVVTKDVRDRSAKVRDTVRRTDVEVDRDESSDEEGDFRAHCTTAFGGQGLSYEQCAPAYRYGYSLGSDQRQAHADWRATEADARRQWEERNPGTWDRFSSAVRYAWERSRGRRAA